MRCYWTWRPWSGVFFVLALMIALAGCGRTSTSASATSMPTPLGAVATSTPVASLPTLAWRAATMPDHLTILHAGITISPITGRLAWVCESSGPNSFTIWQTLDAGVTWHVTGHLTDASATDAGCSIFADMSNPHALVAIVSWGSGEAGNNQDAGFYSSDDAATWRTYPGGAEFATLRGVAIALHGSGLAFSTDGFRTWRVSVPPGMSGETMGQFWVNPTASIVLAAGENGALWKTTDLGADWTKIPTPSDQVTLGRWLAASASFEVCGEDVRPGALQCTRDDGAHWTPVPAMTYTDSCAKCGIGVTTQTTGCNLLGIAPNGALLDSCPGTTTIQGATSFVLYRFTVGASKWTLMGGVSSIMWGIPADGLIWSIPNGLSSLTPYTLQLPA